MTMKCLICDKRKGSRAVDDERLNILEKVNEIFRLNFNESETVSKSKICKSCIVSLDSSYNFYHQIKNARDRLKSTHTVLVKIEIKEEFTETYDAEDFPICNPYESSIKESDESGKDEQQDKLICHDKKILKRKYNKLLPELRKKNRGIRRAKEALTITTDNLYEKEMSDQYTDSLEVLQILDEDKLKDGEISPRVHQLFNSSAWSTFEWICQECETVKKCANIMELNEHLHKIHRTKYKRNCNQCSKMTPHFAAFLNHIIENHASHNKFCCILCTGPEYRWNLKDLYSHYQKEHSETRIIFCIYCGLHFICGAKLKEHLISKHNRENDEGGQFQCDFCGWTTDLRHRMKNHMVKHVTESIFMCDQCTLTFASAAYLSTHIKQVHSKVEVDCMKCGKLFKSERRLRVHDRAVHQDNKQFICHICQKAFHAKYRLNSHLRIHADALEEKYKCSYCDRRFKYKPGMNYHIRAAHTGERPFSCPIEGCDERFFDYSNARKHISGSHNSALKPFRV